MSAPADLPFDLDSLPPAVREAFAAMQAKVAGLEAQTARQDYLIAELRHALYGKRSEQLPPDERQLAFEDLETAVAEAEAARAALAERNTDGRPRRPPAKRNLGHLPDHLPRIEQVIEPTQRVCPCGCNDMVKIGEDRAERLDIVPARFQFRVIVTRRPKYACRSCTDGVAQAAAPARLIPGGLPTEATVAHVLVSKYADHLPLYRQAQIYSRQGVDLDRSTLADWVGRAAFELRPVHDALMADLKRSTKLFMDETRAPVLDPGARKTKTGYFWALARDDRPWGGSSPPAVVFARYRGWMHADGYAGFEDLYRSGAIREVTCMAHVRRKFVDIHRSQGSPIAEEAIGRIAQLYAVEKEARGSPPDRRAELRQAHAAPVFDDLEVWLAMQLTTISGKSPLASAIRYALTRMERLRPYLDNGILELDNNAAERGMRAVALGRKNYLFVGSETGGKAAAIAYTLIETAKLNTVDPHTWLADTLARIPDYKITKVDDLLPWRWNA